MIGFGSEVILLVLCSVTKFYYPNRLTRFEPVKSGALVLLLVPELMCRLHTITLLHPKVVGVNTYYSLSFRILFEGSFS